MVRNYKRLTVANYSQEDLDNAISEIKRPVRPLSFSDAEFKYNIPSTTLKRHVKAAETNVPLKKRGGQTLFNEEEECVLVDHIIVVGEFGQPLDLDGMRHVAQNYLNKQNKKVPGLEDNLPSMDWARGLVQRHKQRLTNVVGRNIKWARAAITQEVIEDYIEELGRSLEGVPPENIINFDETNFTDNPGDKKGLYRRGIKYPTRVCNFTKSSTSVMFAGNNKELLPCYVVYKAKGIFDEWTQGGPPGTFYNRSISGWFDTECFRDWFFRVIVPWAEDREGDKALVGDNLSTHMDEEVIAKCIELNIRFICLIPNSTHLTQPLDVAIFGPVKRQWKLALRNWKQTQKKNAATLPRRKFPRLLKTCLEGCAATLPDNLQSGFRTTGIIPVSAEPLLAKLPKQIVEKKVITGQISEALMEFLTPAQEDTEPKKRQRAVPVEPGRAVTEEEAQLLLEKKTAAAKNKSASRGTKNTKQRNSSKGGGSQAGPSEERRNSNVHTSPSEEGTNLADPTTSSGGGSGPSVQFVFSEEGSDLAVNDASEEGGSRCKQAVKARGQEEMTLDMYLKRKQKHKPNFFEIKKINIKKPTNGRKATPQAAPLTPQVDLATWRLRLKQMKDGRSGISEEKPGSSGPLEDESGKNENAFQSSDSACDTSSPQFTIQLPPTNLSGNKVSSSNIKAQGPEKIGNEILETQSREDSDDESDAESNSSDQSSDNDWYKNASTFSYESFSSFLPQLPHDNFSGDKASSVNIKVQEIKSNKKTTLKVNKNGDSNAVQNNDSKAKYVKRKASSDEMNDLESKRRRKEEESSDSGSDFGDTDITAIGSKVRKNWRSIFQKNN